MESSGRDGNPRCPLAVFMQYLTFFARRSGKRTASANVILAGCFACSARHASDPYAADPDAGNSNTDSTTGNTTSSAAVVSRLCGQAFLGLIWLNTSSMRYMSVPVFMHRGYRKAVVVHVHLVFFAHPVDERVVTWEDFSHAEQACIFQSLRQPRVLIRI